MSPAPRNVLNTEAVDEFLTAVARDNRVAETPAIEKWLAGAARRWILRDYERYWRVERESVTDQLVLVDPHDDSDRVVAPYQGPAPDWIIKAMARGDEIVVVRVNATLRKLLERVIEWTRETAQDDFEPPLTRMAVPDAIREAENWRRSRRQSPDQPPGTTLVYTYGEQYHFLRLDTPEALEIEGDRMVNCVGDYAGEVAQGECQIVSMRQAGDGESRATIEIDPDGYIQQAKGKANAAVAERDRIALRTFVDAFGYKVVWDHESFDLPRGADAAPGLSARALTGFILSDEGQAWLRSVRFATVEDLQTGPVGEFLRNVTNQRRDLREGVKRALVRALTPEGRPILLRPAYAAPIYDEELSVIRVLAPVPFFRLKDYNLFNDRAAEAAQALEKQAAVSLPTLAFRDADRVFDLGVWREAHHGVNFDGLSGGPANLLEESDIDIGRQRRIRLNALRRRMNNAKHRTIGRTAAPSDPHLAMRRLLEGEDGRYVM